MDDKNQCDKNLCIIIDKVPHYEKSYSSCELFNLPMLFDRWYLSSLDDIRMSSLTCLTGGISSAWLASGCSHLLVWQVVLVQPGWHPDVLTYLFDRWYLSSLDDIRMNRFPDGHTAPRPYSGTQTRTSLRTVQSRSLKMIKNISHQTVWNRNLNTIKTYLTKPSGITT
jgi:hypothetical protein